MSLRAVAATAVTVAVVAGGVAHAEPPTPEQPMVLRIATVAPEGSPWAHELRHASRRIAEATQGAVTVRWFFNATAGDELEQLERLKRGQLDGAASGHMLCERLAPSLRIGHLPALFQSRDEASAVIAGLLPQLEREAHQAGFSMLAVSGLGPALFFTRAPVKTLAELRRLKLWRWAADEVGVAASRAMGLDVVALPVWDAARAYDDGRTDGFLAIPSAALAFQWSAQARYLIDLRGAYLFGCLVIADRAFARLTAEQQAAVRDVAARMRERYEDLGRRVDEQLLGGLFAKQGLTVLGASESFRAEFFAAARASRASVIDRYVPPSLVERVQGMLADYRAEHRTNP